jgi:hypothetical protein
MLRVSGGARNTLCSAPIRACTAGRGRHPQYFGVSPPSVHQMVLILERADFIARQPGVARSIKMLVDPQRLPTLR